MEKQKIKLVKLLSTFLLVFASSHALMAQSGTIKGIVTDNHGNVLPGANVVIEGTNLGEMTNLDGVFILENVMVGKQILNVSFIGYTSESKSVTVEDSKTIDISFSMQESSITMNEIMVTASKRSEKLQDVAQSISAITGRGLQQLGATDMRDYISSIPGVKLESPNPIENTISIRGIAPISGWAPTLGYYIDETPVSELGLNPAISSYDMERIEVLRGPQGTLYGEGSMGGTIKMITNMPKVDKMEFRFDPEFSSTTNGGANYTLNGMVNIPIIKNKLAVRAIGFYQNDEGYIDNVGIGIDKVNTYDTYGGRFSLRYLATDKLSFTASAIFSTAEIGGEFTANEDLKQRTSVRENLNDDYSLFNLTSNYELSFADLTVTGSYYNHKKDQVVDLGFIIPVVDYLFGLVGEGPFEGVWTNNEEDFDVYTAEARLVSSNEGSFKWTGGVFYKNYDVEGQDIGDSDPAISQETIDILTDAMGLGELGIEGIFVNEFYRKVKQTAIFGELSYDISPKLNILGGLRLFKEKREFGSLSDGLFPVLQTGLPPTEVVDEGDETVLNPKFTFTYKPSNSVITYATASKGFRSGGQNLFAFMFEGSPTSYDSESLWNYELGVKSTIFNGKLIANAAFFYNDWTDMQLITRSLASLNVVENVGKAHTTGLDAEITWIPLKGLSLSLGGNITKAETDVDITLPAGFDEDTGDELFDIVPEGTELPFVPEYGYNLAAQYRFPISKNTFLTGRIDHNYTGKSSTALVDASENPAYNTTNMRVTLEHKWLEAYGFVNNLTDERVRQAYWFDDPELGTIYAMGRPRTIGLGLRARF